MVLCPEDFDQYLIHYPCKRYTLKGCRNGTEGLFLENSVPISRFSGVGQGCHLYKFSEIHALRLITEHPPVHSFFVRSWILPGS